MHKFPLRLCYGQSFKFWLQLIPFCDGLSPGAGDQNKLFLSWVALFLLPVCFITTMRNKRKTRGQHRMTGTKVTEHGDDSRGRKILILSVKVFSLTRPQGDVLKTCFFCIQRPPRRAWMWRKWERRTLGFHSASLVFLLIMFHLTVELAPLHSVFACCPWCFLKNAGRRSWLS